MADVRSLLRQERASRKQTERPQKASTVPAAAPTSRKRKAVDDTTEERKRTRTGAAKGVPAGFFDGGTAEEDEAAVPLDAQETEDLPTVQKTIHDSPAAAQPHEPQVGVEEAEEIDAFFREMESAPAPERTVPGYAGAVIEAAPMSAAEIAAQAREEQSAQRGKREEEIEAEKEDAARLLEDEFEEMEGLEERVRKLREKREALRAAHPQPDTEDIELPLVPPDNVDEESESDDEDWDDWRFHPA